jgi:hypothetical protein
MMRGSTAAADSAAAAWAAELAAGGEELARARGEAAAALELERGRIVDAILLGSGILRSAPGWGAAKRVPGSGGVRRGRGGGARLLRHAQPPIPTSVVKSAPESQALLAYPFAKPPRPAPPRPAPPRPAPPSPQVPRQSLWRDHDQRQRPPADADAGGARGR